MTWAAFGVQVISAIVTAVLVAITWKYTSSTESISIETRNAAGAARDAAEVSLLQCLLNVQPLLEVRSVEFDYFSSGELAGRIPFRIRWKIANLGRGIAFNPTFCARVADVDMRLADGIVIPVHLDAAQELSLTHQIDSDHIIHSRKVQPNFVTLLMTCSDAFGSLLESEVSLPLNKHEAGFGPASRTYNGGPGLQKKLRKLLDRMLADDS